MKYLPLRDLDTVTTALNFSTPDSHIVGGCDIYTTKAAGGDKKLYKIVEEGLESQYAALMQSSASMSPPYRTVSEDGKEHGKDRSVSKRAMSVGYPPSNLPRASPFGPLTQISSRRTFAYLVATLNASHPDYNFSYVLKPSDFHKEKDLRSVMHNIDNTLQNLRPRLRGFASGTAYLEPATAILSNSAPVYNGFGNEVWSPKMWTLINNEMDLQNCEIYSFDPDHDLLDEDIRSIWSMHYFFFHKTKKRVCYLYLRGFSVISHSPVYAQAPSSKRRRRKASSVPIGDGAGKRASYWLGSGASQAGIDTDNYDDDDDDEMVIDEPTDDEVEVPYLDLEELRDNLANGFYPYYQDDDDDDVLNDGYFDEGWAPIGAAESSGRSRKGAVRGVSEEVEDCIEI